MNRLFLLAALTFTGWSNAQNYTDYELNKPVKKLVIRGYHATQDDRGLKKGEPGWYETGDTDARIEFDKKGRTVLYHYMHDGLDSPGGKITYKYEGDKLVNYTSAAEEHDNKHDASGCLTEMRIEHFIGDAGIVYHTSICQNNHEVERFAVNEIGDTTDHWFYEYDASNHRIRAFKKSNENGLEIELTNAYNSEGKLTKSSILSEGKNEVVEYFYEVGKIVEKSTSTYEEGALTFATETLYDKNGFPKETSRYAPVSVNDLELVTKIVYSYKLDSSGNWIEKRMVVNDSEYYIVQRDITY